MRGLKGNEEILYSKVDRDEGEEGDSYEYCMKKIIKCSVAGFAQRGERYKAENRTSKCQVQRTK